MTNDQGAISGRLMRSVGHDFRNRLGVMKNSTYFLEMKLQGADDKVERHLKLLQSEIERLERMVTDLMDAAWVKNLELAPADVNTVLSQSLGEAEFPAETEVSIQFGQGLAPILVDIGHLKRALSALWAAMPWHWKGSGAVEILVGARDDWAEIRIRDAHDLGTLVPEELFEPGSGPSGSLGLIAARRLMQSMGGTLEARRMDTQGVEYLLTVPTADSKEQ